MTNTTSSFSKVILFEDLSGAVFGPLTELRDVCELRCGAYTLLEKTLRRLSRAGLGSIHRVKWPQSGLTPAEVSSSAMTIILADRVILTQDATERILKGADDECYCSRVGRLIGLRLSRESLQRRVVEDRPFNLESLAEGLPERRLNASLPDYPWELVNLTGGEIAADLELAESENPSFPLLLTADATARAAEAIGVTGDVFIGPGVILDASGGAIRLEEGCRIEAGAILAALNGPIWIDQRAKVSPGAVITGPAYIGLDSIIRQGARLNGEISLGPQCRVGGELNNVIMQGYSNKQHSGYLGSSFISEWVNFGAATDNSDLKNNYRPIDITLNGCVISTSELHLGVIIGDFVRTAIQTRLNSGTAIGCCCNIFAPDFPEKAIPPFIWAGADGYQEYRLDKALETISVVMARRNKRLTPDMESALRNLFSDSADTRREFLKHST